MAQGTERNQKCCCVRLFSFCVLVPLRSRERMVDATGTLMEVLQNAVAMVDLTSTVYGSWLWKGLGWESMEYAEFEKYEKVLATL